MLFSNVFADILFIEEYAINAGIPVFVQSITPDGGMKDGAMIASTGLAEDLSSMS
ncbi:hypothetical protein [Paenibacillus selenitireducens]|uniref:hypothetical protein n=1 Tax=Paenibacillus selenitireducens TaxID=1324314 RepID=UPI0013020107|nr:hypothetical protein [Paenibacillus selenitireducens]